jgi:stage III sporulation protein AH
MNTISAMANTSMTETQVENLLLAKNYADCVAYISGDGITVAVPAPEAGLTAEQVAAITDVITSETAFTAAQLKVVEVKA